MDEILILIFDNQELKIQTKVSNEVDQQVQLLRNNMNMLNDEYFEMPQNNKVLLDEMSIQILLMLYQEVYVHTYKSISSRIHMNFPRFQLLLLNSPETSFYLENEKIKKKMCQYFRVVFFFVFVLLIYHDEQFSSYLFVLLAKQQLLFLD